MSPSIDKKKQNNSSPEESAPVATVEEKKRTREEFEITEEDREDFDLAFHISSSSTSEPVKKKALKNSEKDKEEEDPKKESKEGETEDKKADLTEEEVEKFKKQLRLIVDTGEPALALVEELKGIARRLGLARTELSQLHTTLEHTIERFFLFIGLNNKKVGNCIGTQETANEIRDQFLNLFEPLHSLTVHTRQLRIVSNILTENFEDKLEASLQIEDRFHNSGVITYLDRPIRCTDCNGVTIHLGDKVKAEIEPKVWEQAIVVQLGPSNCIYITPQKSGRTYCKFAYQVEVWD